MKQTVDILWTTDIYHSAVVREPLAESSLCLDCFVIFAANVWLSMFDKRGQTHIGVLCKNVRSVKVLTVA